ncbi:hypothetical protein FQN57_006578 [Myotisia sp. PD_48]|nr:hypothetical protein FQN57_006578 [Myotisia sp. PD_48]
MLTINRQFGKFMKRSADDSHVSVLLKDFDDADKLLSKIIESSKAWRDAWVAIFKYQSSLMQEFETLYNPIIGASENSSDHNPAVVAEETISKVSRLHEEYESLKLDLVAEVSAVDDRIILPATDAREFIQPMKKVIKKRDDKKLDYERYLGRVDSAKKKTKRSDRDNAALAKAEIELSKATDDYNAADDHLRSCLPGIITATFSILPLLLGAQIEIQNTLLAHYYTTLHNYCTEQHFASPPPPMETIIQTWDDNFHNVQREIETFHCLAHGKAVRQPRNSDDHKNGMFANGLGIRSNTKTASRKPSRSPVSSVRAPSAGAHSEPRPRINGFNSTPQLSNTLSPNTQYSPAMSTRTFSDSPDLALSHLSVSLSPVSNIRNGNHAAQSPGPVAGIASMAVAAATKKKPPPPPPRPAGLSTNIQYVTALYDFGGQGVGDLAFREGDRIRVLKKTDSTDDWWEGELRGVKGSFPANYCS